MIRDFCIFMLGMIIGASLCSLADGQDDVLRPEPSPEPTVSYQLLKFESTYCAGCIRLNYSFKNTAVIDSLTKKNIKLIPLNTADHKSLVTAWKVSRVPTLILVQLTEDRKYGKEVKRAVGGLSSTQLLEFLNTVE